MTYGEARGLYGTVVFDGVRYIRTSPPRQTGRHEWEADIAIDAPEILYWPVVKHGNSIGYAEYGNCKGRPDSRRLLSPDFVVTEDGITVETIADEEVDELAPMNCPISEKSGEQIAEAAELYRSACKRFGVNPTQKGFISFACSHRHPQKKLRKLAEEAPDCETLKIINGFDLEKGA